MDRAPFPIETATKVFIIWGFAGFILVSIPYAVCGVDGFNETPELRGDKAVVLKRSMSAYVIREMPLQQYRLFVALNDTAWVVSFLGHVLGQGIVALRWWRRRRREREKT